MKRLGRGPSRPLGRARHQRPSASVQVESRVPCRGEIPPGGASWRGRRRVVYRALHVGLEKSFAVKLLKTAGSPAPAALARFRREALALGRLRHPNIVEVTDSGIDEPTGLPYLVTEFLEGVSLSEICRDQGPLPLARALSLLEEIAGAVDAAHGAGVLHRDLKPGNIFIDKARVKVLDFGLAELLAETIETGATAGIPPGGEEAPPCITSTGALPGTPLYAAPELIQHGKASPATDIYSFGVMAYELLGGKPPFHGTLAEVLNDHLKTEPPPLSLPQEVWCALGETLQKDPALRPCTAGEVVRRLREGAAQAERARWRSAEVPRRMRRAAFLTMVLAAVGLVLPWSPLLPVERWVSDLRVRTSPARPPDPRILLIVLDDEGMYNSPLQRADRVDEVVRNLSKIFAAGARGVAISDQLLDAKWSTSRDFSDLLLRRSGDLTLSALSNSDGSVAGMDCVNGLTAAALGPRRISELFGFWGSDDGWDGVIRRDGLWFRDRSGNKRPSWAMRAARHLDTDLTWESRTPRDFWIDTRIDWSRYSRISWKQVSTSVDRRPELFRNRLVLLGYEKSTWRIPHRHGPVVPYLRLAALTVDTIGAGLPIREPGRVPVLAAAALGATFVMAGALCARRPSRIKGWLIVAAGFYLVISFPVFWWTGLMLPVTAPLLLLLILRQILPVPPEVPTP